MRRLLVLAALSLILSACGSDTLNPVTAQTQSEAPPHTGTPLSPEQALNELMEGNARYVSDTNTCLVRSRDRPSELNSIQHPDAIILACSDSRVDPQLAFDQGWGELFVARVAGNVVDPYSLASIEYGVAELGTRLIVVLGHEGCGAVKATLQGAPLPGQLYLLAQLIQPAVLASAGQPGDRLMNAVDANIAQSVTQISQQSSLVRTAQNSGQVVVRGARYNLVTGSVTWF